MNGARLKTLMIAGLACLMLACGTKSGSDQALASDIQSKLNADAVVRPSKVKVAVKDGVVALSGDVPSSDVELEAMKVANGTAGVRAVNDQMKVNATSAATQLPAAGNPAQQSAGSYPPLSSQPAPPPVEGAAPSSAPAAVITIPAGANVSVRMIDSINSAQNTAGQVFRASLYAPLTSHGRIVVPRGAPASVLLTAARDAGRIKGSSELEVRLSRIEYRGRSYRVASSVYEEQGKGRGKQTAVRTGVGAAAGAVIGAIAGGGKGAAIGSAAGGGAGFGSAALTHGQRVRIPSETVLSFRLEAPLTITR